MKKMMNKDSLHVSGIMPIFSPATVYGGPIYTSYDTYNKLSELNVKIFVSTTDADLDKYLEVQPNVWIKEKDNFFIKYYHDTIVNTFSLRLYLFLWKDILNADVVHIQTLFRTPIPLALLLAKIFQKPVLLTPHGSLGKWSLNQGSRFKRIWLDWLIKPLSSKVVWHATAEDEKSQIISVIPKAKVIVIPNGINTDEYNIFNQMKKDEFLKTFAHVTSDVDHILISMGRLHKVKGFDILIDAFSMIVCKYPKAKLLIAGEDAGEKYILEKQISDLKLKYKVFLIGSVNGQRKIDFLANADLFILPSHHENFGNVYAESLAAGTPIIASKNTPWEEVEKYNCGKWVNNNSKTLADTMETMLQENLRVMGINGKRYIEKFDWKNIAIQFKFEYEKILEEYKNNKEA